MAEDILEKENYRPTFSFYCILKDVLSRWLIIFICGCLFAMGGYIYSTESYSPIYNTNTTFLITDKNTQRDVSTTLSTTTSLASVFLTLIESPEFQNKLAQNMDLQSIPGTVTVNQVPETNMITVQTSSASPRTSYELLQCVMETYPEFTMEIMENMLTETLEPPTVPKYPSNSSTTRNLTPLLFLIGVFISTVFVATLSFFNDTIKIESDINKKLTIPLLTTVPINRFSAKIKRRHTPIQIDSGACSFHFIESIKKLRTAIENENRTSNSQVFIVTSTLPNEGKSTISANLALSLAKKDTKVLLIDADLHNPSLLNFFNEDFEEDKEWKHFLSGDKKLSEVILHHKDSSLNMLLNKNFTPDASDLMNRESFAYIFNSLKLLYDYIIVDTPPLALVTATEDVMQQADVAILTIKQDFARAIDINETVNIIESTGTKVLGCVLNNVSRKTMQKFWYGSNNYYRNNYYYGD